MQHTVHISQIELEDPDTTTFSSNVSSECQRLSEQRLSYLETELEIQIAQIKDLQAENKSIQQERDEVLEEYEDELKAIKHNNELLIRENIEIRQEIKILYSKVESLQLENERLLNLKSRNRELELVADQNKKFIKQLQETNKILSKRLVQQGSETDEEAMMKIIELSHSLNDSQNEVERLRQCLLKSNMLYAESETERENLYQRVKGLIDRKRFSWRFWKFWG